MKRSGRKRPRAKASWGYGVNSIYSNDITTQPQCKLDPGEVYLGRILFKGSEHSLIRNNDGEYIIDNGKVRYQTIGTGTKQLEVLLLREKRCS